MIEFLLSEIKIQKLLLKCLFFLNCHYSRFNWNYLLSELGLGYMSRKVKSNQKINKK